MTLKVSASIPIVDLCSTTSPADDADIARTLDDALTGHGFCYLRGHNVDPLCITDIFHANQDFHQLSQASKDAVKINAFHRGYIGLNESTTVTSSVESVTQPNQSESFMLMQPVGPDHARWGTAVFGPNQWPDTLMPAFQERCLRYYTAMVALAHELTQRLATALGHKSDVFDNAFSDPTVFLRLIRYPACNPDSPAQTCGSAAHTDHGFVTLVAQDSNGGLEVRNSDHRWVPVEPIPGTLVLNVADMLSLWSGGRWLSTPHRVVLNDSERYSVAFFFDPAFDTTVQPLGGLGESSGAERSLHYGHYLMERFDKNYDYRCEE